MTAARDRKRTRSPRSMWTSMGRSVSGGDLGAKFRRLTSLLDGLFDERNVWANFPFVAVVSIVNQSRAFIHGLHDEPIYQFQTHIAGAQFIAII